ncbi:uncharacterized protein HKW66_Vig0172950 [Vigna angularis]|uniref:NET2A-D/KIP1-like alpha-helical domain-containing protein n=1 Tax=Phaseolus angularis TaxID=3914 RepID=A0A8T0JTJ0_PHAAN|nr:uncharacterized protein HKW66_Vig0172950 [Vigna angularis]
MLQDDLGVGTMIEDIDARTLMAVIALKSCQETLDKLKDIQVQASKEAKEEYQRVKKAHKMFETLRDPPCPTVESCHQELQSRSTIAAVSVAVKLHCAAADTAVELQQRRNIMTPKAISVPKIFLRLSNPFK